MPFPSTTTSHPTALPAIQPNGAGPHRGASHGNTRFPGVGFVRPQSLPSVLPTPPVLITSIRACTCGAPPPYLVKHYRLEPIASFSGADRVGGARPVPAPLLHTNRDAMGLLL